MKHLEYVYFNIYSYYQQRSRDLTNFSARLQTMYIVSFSIGGWILFMQAAFLRLVRGSWFSSQSASMSFAVAVYLSTAAILYRVFIINNYDEKIYNKYERSGSSSPQKSNSLFLSVLVAAIPYLLLVSLKLFFPRQH